MQDCKSPLMGAVPTAMMMEVGVWWPDVLEQAQHVINVLESQSENCLSIAKGILKLIKAVTKYELLEIFNSLGELRVSGTELIAAVRKEFQLD